MPSPEQPFMFDVNFSFGSGSVFTEINNEEAGLVEIERAVLLAIVKRDGPALEVAVEAKAEPQPEEENV